MKKTIAGYEFDISVAQEDDIFQMAALETTHARCCEAALKKIIESCASTGALAPDEIQRAGQNFINSFSLGDCSKRRDSLAEKKARAWLKESLKERGYRTTDASAKARIDDGIAALRAGETIRGRTWIEFDAEAQGEIEPERQLDPIPLSFDEFKEYL